MRAPSKGDAYDLVPYMCTDGATAVRIPELGVRFVVPRGEPERFSHAFAAMAKQFRDDAETETVLRLRRRPHMGPRVARVHGPRGDWECGHFR